MMKTRAMTLVRFLLLCVFLHASCQVFAEDALNKTSIKRVGTVTLFVKKYGDLEIQLDNALATNNKKSINQLLGENFEERKSDNPNAPIPREDWIAAKIKLAGLTARTLRQMAVRKLDNIYIVSYIESPKNTLSSHLVVDVWRSSENDKNNQLMARYSY